MSGRGERARRYAAGVLFVVMGLSTTAFGEDLAEEYALARRNDPTYGAARFALDAARQTRPEAFSALLPNLIATGSDSRTTGRTSYTGVPLVSRAYNGDQWALQLTQPLFRVDALLVYDEARATVEEALAQYAAAEADLILRVARAYFDVAVAEGQVSAAHAQVIALDEQLSAAKRSFAAGIASVTDVDDTQSRAALAKSQEVAAGNDLGAARAVLESITGQTSDNIAHLKTEIALPLPDPEDVAPWIARATAESPGVRAAQAALKVAEYEVSRSHAQRLPVIDMVASYGGNYSAGNTTELTNYGTHVRDRSIGVQFSLPLLDGGAISARVTEARAKRAKAQADLEGAARQAALTAKQSYAAVFSGAAQVKALTTGLAAGRNAVKGNRVGYGLGIRINSDVLNAEQQLYTTLQDLQKARYDALFAGLRLKAAAGQLSPADVEAVNRLLTFDAIRE